MERKLYKLVKKLAILYYRFLCLVLPVNQKRVVFDSSLGKSYAGNPKYIYEYLVANGYDIKWDCIWFYEKDKYNTRHEPSGPVRKNEVPVLYGYSQDLGV